MLLNFSHRRLSTLTYGMPPTLTDGMPSTLTDSMLFTLTRSCSPWLMACSPSWLVACSSPWLMACSILWLITCSSPRLTVPLTLSVGIIFTLTDGMRLTVYFYEEFRYLVLIFLYGFCLCLISKMTERALLLADKFWMLDWLRVS